MPGWIRIIFFHLHDPLTVEIDVPEDTFFSNLWKNPKSWHEFDLPPIVVSECYDKVVSKNKSYHESTLSNDQDHFDESLRKWAQNVEDAISMAVSYQHEADPNRQPFKSLPHAYRGRCTLHKKSQEPPRSSPGGCKGHFNPNTESFTVKIRQKIRQVRRLQSLILNVKKHPFQYLHPSRQNDILLEWNCIRTAPGYGRSWERWLLSYEVVEYVPQQLPDLEWLEGAKTITEIDAQTFSYIESSNRAKETKLKISLDVSQGFSRFTYKYLQKPSNPPLRDIAVTWKSEGVLLRSSKGNNRIRVKDYKPWRLCAPASFGECQIEITKIENNVLDFRILNGILPTNAQLTQHTYACTPSEISCAFRDFWSGYWLRDTTEEQFSDATWQPVIDDLEEMPKQVPICHIDMHDPLKWKQTALGMKKGKASGADGFSPEDLYILPLAAFKDFADIVSQQIDKGLSYDFLVARTVLLSKIPQPETIHHGRPITIFGVLFRLITRHIARQLMAHWKKYIPKEISGGIPGSGVQDISLAQQSLIENNLFHKTPLSGFTLDLVKAFNLVPRRAAMHIMVHYGAPKHLILFWMKCLSKMSRRVQLDYLLDEPIYTTTGVPEGDCLSVSAMTAISWMFWEKMSSPTIRAFCYADNWSWMTSVVQANIRCFHLLISFAEKLKLQIDYAKSWAWVTSAQVRKEWDNVTAEFPPGIEIRVLEAAKDLGACVNYTRSKRIGPFRERFEAAMAGFHKLKYSQLSMQQKFEKIQVALLPRAFYAAEVCSPSESFFQICRRNITAAVVTAAKHASSDIACHFLTWKMQDPFVYVLTTALRNLRRYYGIHPEDALRIWERAVSYGGKKSYGPGTSLSVLIRRIGWSLGPEGVIRVPGASPFSLFQASNREITDFCNYWWNNVVHDRVTHRKGFDINMPLSKRLTVNAFLKLDDSSQKFVAQYITVSFQTELVKTNWDANNTGLCPLCNLPDTHCHRVFECPAMVDVRFQHEHAVSLMKNNYKSWPWAPIAYRHNDETYIKMALELRRLPMPFLPTVPDDNKFVFYTDGSAHASNKPFARHASFSVVQDLRSDLDPIDIHGEINSHFDMSHLHISTLAFCPGKQSVTRAELAAVVNVAMAMSVHFPDAVCDVYTDAQYVLRCLEKFVLSYDNLAPFHKVNNQDLIKELQKYWDPVKHHLHKVKAHRQIQHEADPEVIRHIVGNNAADQAAKAARQRESNEILQAIERLEQRENKHGCEMLLVFSYLSDLGKTRLNKMPKKHLRTGFDNLKKNQGHADQQPMRNPCSERQCDSFRYLSSWDPGDSHIFCDDCDIPPETLQAISGGTKFGWAVLSWLKTIRWYQSDEPYQKDNRDYGITWVELLFNFRICTGAEIPVFVEQHTTVSSWVMPSSDQAQMLPMKLKSISAQIVILEGCVRQIQTLLGVRLTWGPRGKPPSLWHCGFFQRKNGFLRRPVISFADETMGELKRYLTSCSSSFNDLHDFEMLGLRPPLPCEVVDLEPKARRKRYEQILAIKRNRG